MSQNLILSVKVYKGHNVFFSALEIQVCIFNVEFKYLAIFFKVCCGPFWEKTQNKTDMLVAYEKDRFVIKYMYIYSFSCTLCYISPITLNICNAQQIACKR